MPIQIKDLPQSRIEALLMYNPESGKFYHKTSGHGRVFGQEAGCSSHRRGGIVIQLDGRQLQAGRLAWILSNGTIPPGFVVDHIDGNRKNNRLSNLRILTHQENTQNIHVQPRTGKSGILGIRLMGGRWTARILIDGVRVHLGTFETPELAKDAYMQAKRRYHKGFTL